MAQPTLSGMTLNAGADGLDLLYDLIGDKVAQVTLQAFSTGDGALNVVMADAPLPTTDAAVLAKLTTIDVDTSKITACNTGAVVLATGTASIGKLAANDGVDIGDVTINNASIAVTGTFWQTTQPVSVASIPSHAVTNAGTFVVQIDGAALTALQKIDDCISGNEAQVDVITVPAPLNLVGGGTEAAAMRVTLANDSTGTLTVDTTGTSGLEVVQGTSADLKCTEASASDIKTAVEKIDDWDESDRAKVNPIAGQAGIAANAGNMDALTTRVVIATNDTHYGTVGASSDIDGVVHGQLRFIADQLVTIDVDTNAIKTAVELLDNAVDGNYLNVNLNAAGTDLAMNAGAMSAQTTRVTLATDDTHYGQLGAASDIDGNVHGQLRYIADQLVNIDSDTNNIKTAVELLDDTVVVLGTATYAETTTKGNVVGTVRNDDLAPLANTDNEIAPFQTNSEGALYATLSASEEKRASGVAVGGTPGTDDIIAAVGSRKIRILALGLFATSATVNNVFLDNADNDLLFNTGNPLPLSLDADADTVPGFVLPYNPGGWMETDTVNEAVTLNSSAAQDIAWTITYIEVL